MCRNLGPCEGDLGPVVFSMEAFGADYVDCETDYYKEQGASINFASKIKENPTDRRMMPSALEPTWGTSGYVNIYHFSPRKLKPLRPCHLHSI